MAKHKVYIEVEDRSPFGDSVDPRVFQDAGETSNYIPGYSEKRVQNEVRTANHEPIVPLKHRFHWARAKYVNNVELDDGRDIHQWKQKRYEVAQYDDVISQGYNLKENTAIWRDADGRARWGEHVLMIASDKVAAAHLKMLEQTNADLQQRSEYIVENAVEDYNRGKTAQKTGPLKAGAFEQEE